jgi:hypothetical protein
MIEPAGRPNSRPLTHGQRLIWLGQRLHPRTPLYNMVLAFDIGGAIEPIRFDRASSAGHHPAPAGATAAIRYLPS